MAASDNDIIADMTRQVLGLCEPCMIYLVSGKRNSKGELTGFKLCIVAPDEESPDILESRLLINTECDVPCDFIVYNLTDWNEYAEDDCSFAYRVENGGELLYVQRQ